MTDNMRRKWEIEWDQWADRVSECEDPLPRDEALALLRGLTLLQRTGDIGSAMHRHYEETGHRLSFGCCAVGAFQGEHVA